ncbi:hypothetical protein C1I93_26580 [Micromonospora endophytica]|uniref:OsmC-like protein n=1 Tax=Micromonospora endophytica TaxID=515350 RepID=A0A2W2BPD9_9ACTN|nr:hypothetical protein C1I93_26580 [Micromonospora endophytica]
MAGTGRRLRRPGDPGTPAPGRLPARIHHLDPARAPRPRPRAEPVGRAGQGRGRRCRVTTPPVERTPYTLALRTTEVIGRFEADGGAAVFTIDNGKLLEYAEHPGTADYFLASLAGCALNLIAARSVEWELPYPQLEIGASYLVDENDSTRFASIELSFSFADTDVEQSRRYVDDFAARCPIYNTLVRGGAPISIEVTTA